MDIAIVGGGIGGLTLARILQVNGINATVYELDPSRESRGQGGTFDLHEEHGQAALGAAGLTDEFRARVRPGGDAVRIFDRWGTCLLDDAADDGDGNRPEIDRRALKDMLLNSVHPSRIRWGKKAVRVVPAGGRHEVAFADGSMAAADLVVGADGAWSAVRSALSAERPRYSGFSFVELVLDDADRRYPLAARFVGGGTMFALADGQGVMAQRNGDGSIRVYVSLREDEEWIGDEARWKDPVRARDDLAARFDDWPADVVRLITDSEGPVIPRPIFDLPVGYQWAHIPGVTLLGDAAHLMSPFGGHGANLAMFDAAELGGLIAGHPGHLEHALAEYESGLFARSPEFAASSASELEMCHTEEAPRVLTDIMISIRHTSVPASREP